MKVKGTVNKLPNLRLKNIYLLEIPILVWFMFKNQTSAWFVQVCRLCMHFTPSMQIHQYEYFSFKCVCMSACVCTGVTFQLPPVSVATTGEWNWFSLFSDVTKYDKYDCKYNKYNTKCDKIFTCFHAYCCRTKPISLSVLWWDSTMPLFVILAVIFYVMEKKLLLVVVLAVILVVIQNMIASTTRSRNQYLNMSFPCYRTCSCTFILASEQ